MYVCLCVNIYTHKHVFMCIYTIICIYYVWMDLIYAYVCMYVCMYV